MKFESASEALRWYVKICSIGVCGGGASKVDKDDENELLPNEVDTGPADPMLWANLIHMKVDIENAFLRCFPDKRGKWVQNIMFIWAVDGYEDALRKLCNVSPHHKKKCSRTHESELSRWIYQFTDELIRIGYIKKKSAYSKIDLSFLLTSTK